MKAMINTSFLPALFVVCAITFPSTATAQNPGASRLSVRSVEPEIPAQHAQTGRNFSDSGVEVYFPQGMTAERTAQFNEALPVIRATLGIMSCARKSEQSQAATVLRRYSIEGGARSAAPDWYLPMGMSNYDYHDENLCVTVKKLAVNIPAPNAIALTVTYLATDSLEEVRSDVLYQKNYRGVWQLAKMSNIHL